ncbi:MAG TPA: protein kinase [Kofleriaceae bacterium]|jgi:tetratricopeptide (TPR) repeat protein/tRNA A-37 threonylcarbamoyl transferase component Bud32
MRSVDAHPECPPAEDLVRMVEGGLADDLTAELEAHIDHCESCRFAVSGLALGSTARPSGRSLSHDHAGLAGIDPDHYALGDELARGGMGRIFRARDRRLGRDVAIKETFAHGGDAMRFEREARITARLQHPSIVQVHEAGVWPTGEPFFAMQLVNGRSLDDAIATATTLDARLALVPNALAVADAIAYAHSQGIIHRDLKPKNVIVGEFGETVVIDWGLAKDLAASEPEAGGSHDSHHHAHDEAHTALGAVIGTPAYMPPEQAHGDAVDRRADVYALGAILYHVLSGRPPVTGRGREEVLATVASGGVQPLAELQPDVPADLLAIVAKAMAHEPRGRYADARELAQDLRKFQTGQLVGARRYAWPHLVARWLRRHRTAVAVAGAALVVLAVVGAVSLREIVGAKHVAETERATAEQNRGDAEDLLGFMLGDLHEKLQPLGKTELLDTVANKAIEYYHRRSDRVSSEDRQKLGVAISNLGEVLVDEGHSAQGLAQYRAALAMAETFAALEPGNPARWKSLAARHERIGDVLMTQGHNAEALEDFRVDLAIATQLAAAEPEDVRHQRDLDVAHFKVAGVLTEMGRLDEAIAQFRAAIAVSEHVHELAPSSKADRDLALDHMELAMALTGTGANAEGVAEHRKALALLDHAIATDPNDAQTRATLLDTHMMLAQTLAKAEQHAAAIDELHAAIAIGEKLAARDPDDVSLHSNIAFCRTELAESEHALGRDDAAIADLKAALPVQTALAAQDPTQLDHQHDIEVNHRTLAEILLARHDLDGARRELAATLELATTLGGKDPNNAAYSWDLGEVHMRLGQLETTAGHREAAVAEVREALALREAAVAADPGNADRADDVVTTRAALAELTKPAR